MTRVRHTLVIALPSLLVGGLLFGFWPAAADNRDPWLNAQPAPPAPPTPPTPPTPPAPPSPRGGGVSIKLRDGKVTVEGVTEMVRKQLDSVRDIVRDNPHIPPPVRANVLARLERVRNAVERRLSKIKSTDMDQLGEEMERVGEDIEEAMNGLDEDLGKLGKQLAKQFGKQWKKEWKKGRIEIHGNSDGEDNEDNEDDEEAEALPPVDPEDTRAAIADVRGIALQPQQRLQIQRLREASDREIAQAETQLATLSNKLEQALANPKVSDDEVRRYVDSISQTEATIRKARLLAWVGARRVLDEQQRAKIEAAARQRSRQR
jgi:hypothetical protein